MLSEEERQRYRRQIILPDWGEAGQERLKRAKVVVVGAGGLGSAALAYLAVAGVGKIRIIDHDRVELSNLNRQMLHSDKDVGKRKADSAKARLEALNPDIVVEAFAETITEKNSLELIADYLIVDALDNLPARYLLNKVALRTNRPLFHGAVCGFEGRATTIHPGRTPCLACLYEGAMPGEIPVVGVTPGIIGCVQATEVIKHILGIGELLTNRMLVCDGRTMTFSEMKLKRNPNCRECGEL
ncbi:MAG: HesA/MoeB/ThiF family protein [Chloroflexi bacterium]|nr:HesA/MoeB/ThiF family protein [Chloroflexota bacterium]